MNKELLLEMAKEAGLKAMSETALSPAEEDFAYLLLEEVMQILAINDHGKSIDLLNARFGFEE